MRRRIAVASLLAVSILLSACSTESGTKTTNTTSGESKETTTTAKAVTTTTVAPLDPLAEKVAMGLANIFLGNSAKPVAWKGKAGPNGELECEGTGQLDGEHANMQILCTIDTSLIGALGIDLSTLGSISEMIPAHISVDFRLVNGRGYVNASATAEYLPADRPWLGFGEVEPDPESAVQTIGQGVVAIKDAGPDEVNGVATTKYEITYDLIKMAPTITMFAALIKEQLSAKYPDLDLHMFRALAWLDADGNLRKAQLFMGEDDTLISVDSVEILESAPLVEAPDDSALSSTDDLMAGLADTPIGAMIGGMGGGGGAPAAATGAEHDMGEM